MIIDKPAKKKTGLWMIIDKPAKKKTGHGADRDNTEDYADRSSSGVFGGGGHLLMSEKHSFPGFAIEEEVAGCASHDKLQMTD